MSKTATVIVEGAKVLISAYFSYMQVSGKSKEEIKDLFEKELAEFMANAPEKLEDV